MDKINKKIKYESSNVFSDVGKLLEDVEKFIKRKISV